MRWNVERQVFRYIEPFRTLGEPASLISKENSNFLLDGRHQFTFRRSRRSASHVGSSYKTFDEKGTFLSKRSFVLIETSSFLRFLVEADNTRQ
jgi:hypothetical protein